MPAARIPKVSVCLTGQLLIAEMEQTMSDTRVVVYMYLLKWFLAETISAVECERVFLQLWVNDNKHRKDPSDVSRAERFVEQIECFLFDYKTEDELRAWVNSELTALRADLESEVRSRQSTERSVGALIWGTWWRLPNHLRQDLPNAVQENSEESHSGTVAKFFSEEPGQYTRFACYVSAVGWWVEGAISASECDWILLNLAENDAEAGGRSWNPLEQRFLDAVKSALSQQEDQELAQRTAEAALRMLEAEPETGHTPTA